MVYNFNELSDNAKEQVREWYLNGQDAEFFYEDCVFPFGNFCGKTCFPPAIFVDQFPIQIDGL